MPTIDQFISDYQGAIVGISVALIFCGIVFALIKIGAALWSVNRSKW